MPNFETANTPDYYAIALAHAVDMAAENGLTVDEVIALLNA